MPSQDLVPDDLPYGDRQRTVGAMQAASLPLESSVVGSESGVSATRNLPAQRGPATDPLTTLSPSAIGAPPLPSASERLRTAAASSPNTLFRLVVEKVLSE